MQAITNEYAFGRQTDLPFDAAVDAITEALKGQGFGTLTRIDIQATLDQKLGVPFRPYVILGACNPVLAHQALSAELPIGLLLPCNVIVYEEGNGSVISIVDPQMMLAVADNDALHPLAEEARARLERALAAIP